MDNCSISTYDIVPALLLEETALFPILNPSLTFEAAWNGPQVVPLNFIFLIIFLGALIFSFSVSSCHYILGT